MVNFAGMGISFSGRDGDEDGISFPGPAPRRICDIKKNFQLGSCFRSPAAVAPRVYRDGAAAEEQIVIGRMRRSKSKSAAHWRPALTAISEDSDGALSPAKKSGDKKPQKQTSGRRGRFMNVSYGYHRRDNYSTNLRPEVVMPPFSPTTFIF